jgi:hypothetical protein
VTAPFRAPASVLVVDGQSLNNVPSCWADEVMVGVDRNYYNVARNGYPWAGTNLVSLHGSWLYRIQGHAHESAHGVLTMLGGQSDVLNGADGATIYARMVAYSARAKADGIAEVIACTMTPGVVPTAYSSGQNTERLAANVLILADASNAFDAVVDLAVDPRLDDPADLTYYNADGLHLTAAGVSAVADLMETPVLTALGVA